MLYHFSEDRCAVESLVESFAATTRESLPETSNESACCVATNTAHVLPNAVLCITNVREHTMIPPNANLTKPEFLIHQYVRVHWGTTDLPAADTPGLILQKDTCLIYVKKT